MAAPETQRQGASLQATGYSPVVTQLGTPNMGAPGAGQLWAQVGKTAMDASGQFFNTLMNSPLNPTVRKQMEAQRASAQAGIDQYNYAQDHPVLRMTMGTDAHGNAIMTPAIQTADPTTAAQIAAAYKAAPAAGTGGEGAPAIAPGTGRKTVTPAPTSEDAEREQHPDWYYLNPSTGSWERRTDAPPPAAPSKASDQAKKPPTLQEMGTPSQATASQRPYLSASAGTGPIPTTATGEQGYTSQPAADYRAQYAAQRPMGAPQGTFLNPATGSYEPLQQAPPSAPTEPAQAVPPQQVDQAQVAAQQEAQKQQQLQAWQAQNAHPVASAQDALNWAKRFHTGYRDATYLPHGGPGGEPAFNFTDKSGASNIVPISQMVKNGFGPTVASQNTSSVLGVAGQAQQAGQGPHGPGLPFGPMAPANAPPAPGQPGPAGAQPGLAGAQTLPPAQPGQQPLVQSPSTRNVTTTTVPEQDRPLYAQTGSGPLPAAAQPPLAPAESISDADRSGIEQKAKDMGDLPPGGDYTGDRKINYPGYPYAVYRDDDPGSASRGRAYTVLPGKAGEYYNPQKWYLGTREYVPYELPDSLARKTVADYWIPTGKLSRAEVDKMSPDELKPWLGQMWRNQNLSVTPAGEGINNKLDTLSTVYKDLQQINDANEALGKDPNYAKLSESDRTSAEIYNRGLRLSPEGTTPKNFVQGLTSGYGELEKKAAQMSPDAARAIEVVQQKSDEVRRLLDGNPNLLLPIGKTAGQGMPNIDLRSLVGSFLPVGFDLGLQNVSPRDALQSIFSGRDISDRRQGLAAFRADVANRYKETVGEGHTNLQRVTDEQEANLINMTQGRRMRDDGNPYQEQTLPSKLTADQITSRAKNNPESFPRIMNADDLTTFRKTHPGEAYRWWNPDTGKMEIRQASQ